MASPANSSNQASGSGSKQSETIDAMLLRLGIEEDELDDLVFEEEESISKEIKWMALAKVHTTNFFSPQTFEQHMKVAWSPAKEVQFHQLEGNLFTIQCFCLGDWLKIEEGGPWLFRQNAVCFQKYDGFAPPESVDLNTFETWIQIHKLPVGYRKVPLIKNLTERKVGKAVKVEIDVHGAGNFVRVRVVLDVRKPLARVVTISRAGQREFYQIKYEKLPKFCGACGLMGHTHLECGSGEHDEDKLKWGDFLKADWDTWHGRGLGGFRGGSRAGNRGRGREGPLDGRGRGGFGQGRDVQRSWRYNALPYSEGEGREENEQKEEQELDDTGASPVKTADMEVENADHVEALAKRRLNLTFDDEDTNVTLVRDAPLADNAIVMAMEGVSSPPDAKDDGTRMDRKKRSKKDGANSPSLGSAGSREESVRSQ
jgi:hypothetical protein